jgi:type VI secretion system protein VasG
VDSGARIVDHILTRTLLPEIAETVLAKMAEGTRISHVKVAIGEDGNFAYEIT